MRREVLEECGYAVEIVQPIGFAIEYVFAEGEGYFAKECSFFEATLGMRLTDQSEVDHQLEWLAISEAIEELGQRSPGQAWVVSNFVGGLR